MIDAATCFKVVHHAMSFTDTLAPLANTGAQGGDHGSFQAHCHLSCSWKAGGSNQQQMVAGVAIAGMVLNNKSWVWLELSSV